MRISGSWKRCILLIGVVGLMTNPVFGNPIFVKTRPLTPDDLSLWPKVIVASTCLAIEALALWVLLRRSEGLPFLRCSSSFLLVHLISYPITLLLVGPLGYFSEVFPLVFEPWLFPRITKVGVKQALGPVIISNCISFAMGLLLPSLWIQFLPAWH